MHEPCQEKRASKREFQLCSERDRGEEQNHSRTGCSAVRCSECVIAQLQNWCSAITYFWKLVWFWDHVTWSNAFLRRHLHFKKVQKQCTMQGSRVKCIPKLIFTLTCNNFPLKQLSFFTDITKDVQAIG